MFDKMVSHGASRVFGLVLCDLLNHSATFISDDIVFATSPCDVEGLSDKMVSHGAPDEDDEGCW